MPACTVTDAQVKCLGQVKNQTAWFSQCLLPLELTQPFFLKTVLKTFELIHVGHPLHHPQTSMGSLGSGVFHQGFSKWLFRSEMQWCLQWEMPSFLELMDIRGRNRSSWTLQLLLKSDSDAANKSKLGTCDCNFNLIMLIDERKRQIRKNLI